MEIGAMLDELREKALKDRNIWQQLMDTRKKNSHWMLSVPSAGNLDMKFMKWI